jgi:hypothetical protein
MNEPILPASLRRELYVTGAMFVALMTAFIGIGCSR